MVLKLLADKKIAHFVRDAQGATEGNMACLLIPSTSTQTEALSQQTNLTPGDCWLTDHRSVKSRKQGKAERVIEDRREGRNSRAG